MNKTVVITGTSSGLGKATVERFSSEGWNVVATVRKKEQLGVHAELPQVKTLLLDVDDETAATQFAVDAVAAFGQVDVLVNNAGYFQMGPLESSSMEQIHRQFQTNVFGLLALTQAFLPIFREQRSGVVVNIASIGAEGGYPFTSVYSSSKSAVLTISEALNIEMLPFNVQVKAVMPGQHATRIFSKIDGPEIDVEAYRNQITAFFDHIPESGSDSSVVGDVVYAAATDGRNNKVHYYAGPDALAIPRMKRILGIENYWEEFQQFALGQPSPLWQVLNVPAGDSPLERIL
ncbi:SDR family oxidoreductase [Herbiconiux sp. CPCC 205716]|uniref:SDR family oxidoreductase n=1 Tax=Herbiconiux gentiana TaxID=2970912 RepID=A0ABT2GD72_9MICO|nr:SDR family oxidoreductase [Herbiconiux gentiana]MCS5714176.1 SDR family oxidoreductase [Herbiconiux gentiana]